MLRVQSWYTIQEDPDLEEPYQRYLVVGYDDYYPQGFSKDIIADTDDLTEACAFLRSLSYEHREIFDLDARETIVWAEDDYVNYPVESERASEIGAAWVGIDATSTDGETRRYIMPAKYAKRGSERKGSHKGNKSKPTHTHKGHKKQKR